MHYLLNGVFIRGAFVHDGIKYPANWLTLALPEERAAIGVIDVPDPTPPADYSADLYDLIEDAAQAPYLFYQRKSDTEIAHTRWERLKQIRDELTEYGGCEIGGKWFHADVRSKQQQIALVMMGAGIPANLQWKTMDGSFLTMTQQLAAQVFAAQAAREQAIFAVAEAKRLDDSPVGEGWPARYEGAA